MVNNLNNQRLWKVKSKSQLRNCPPIRTKKHFEKDKVVEIRQRYW